MKLMDKRHRTWRALSSLRAFLSTAVVAAMAVALLPAGSARAGTGGEEDYGPCECNAPYLVVLHSHRTDMYRALYHEGKGEIFGLHVAFNKDVALERRHIRVEGGRVTKIKNHDDSKHSDEWTIRIRATTEGRLTVTFPADNKSWEIINDDANETVKLKETHRRYVFGPKPALRVRSVRQKEKGSRMAFTVSLNKPLTESETVTVDYTTADGSAKAGEDYEAVSGTLTFEHGGREEQYIPIYVYDDGKDEGREFFKFKLSNATGAFIDRGNARGIILNSDPLPKAAMAHFGHSVASQVVDTVTDRFGGGQSHLTLGGHRIGATRMEFNSLPVSESSTMDARELLMGSSFHLTTEDMGSAPQLSAWGRTATNGFSAGSMDDLTMDGTVTSALVGTDVSSGRLLAGMAMSYSRGEDSFDLTSGLASNRDGGNGESTLTSVHPYAQYRLGDHSSVWAITGHGTGTFTLTERRGVPIETDIAMTMGAVGARSALIVPEQPGGFALAVKADAMWMQMESASVRSERTGNLASSKARSSRVRTTIEGRRTFGVGRGQLIPTLAASLRKDAGDAGAGAGVEIGAGILYAAESVTLEGVVHRTVAYDQADHDEWDASASVHLDSGAGRALLGLDGIEPYAELLADEGSRVVNLGARWQVAPAFTMSMEGSQDEAADRSFMLRTSLRW